MNQDALLDLLFRENEACIEAIETAIGKLENTPWWRIPTRIQLLATVNREYGRSKAAMRHIRAILEAE